MNDGWHRIYFGLFVTGLAMSLHCVGMCGPLVVGFSKVFEQTRVTIEGAEVGAKKASWWSGMRFDFCGITWVVCGLMGF